MIRIYMEVHDLTKNMHRFYQMIVTPGIFDNWSLIKEWGRVGSPGTVRKEWFESEEEAAISGQKLCEKKRKKGYKTNPYYIGRCTFADESKGPELKP
jgi:predicted DNA-binding WGR domain protein